VYAKERKDRKKAAYLKAYEPLFMYTLSMKADKQVCTIILPVKKRIAFPVPSEHPVFQGMERTPYIPLYGK